MFKSAKFLAAAAGLALAVSASANVTVFVMRCQHPAGLNSTAYDGLYTFPVDTTGWNTPGLHTWTMPQAWEFYDNEGNLAGSVDSATFEVNGDPLVTLNFSVTSGFTSTTFQMDSAVVSFGALSNVTGRASMALSITDSPLNGVGGTLTGLYGGMVYQAQYNGTNIFTNLLSSTPYAGGTTTYNSASATYPLFLPVAGNVSDISSTAKFSISAFDRAAVTSTFEINGEIPAPGAAGLIGLGGLALLRRRSR